VLAAFKLYGITPISSNPSASSSLMMPISPVCISWLPGVLLVTGLVVLRVSAAVPGTRWHQSIWHSATPSPVQKSPKVPITASYKTHLVHAMQCLDQIWHF
jgi:hypothetical protein